MRTIRHIIIVWFMIGTMSCSSDAPTCLGHPELAKSYISPSPEHVGHLVHRNKCKEVKLYKLDMQFQKLAYSLNFTCVVGGKTYSFCKDQLGLCRNIGKGKRKADRFWRKKRDIEKKFIPWSNYTFLVNAATLCKSGL